MINRTEITPRKHNFRKNENIINFDEPICKKLNRTAQEISVCIYLSSST